MGAYARAGVNYSNIIGFKHAMTEMGKGTRFFPQIRNVTIGVGGTHYYTGSKSHAWKQVTEGLGNKNWIASWMEMFAGTDRTYHEGIGVDTIRMATNDLLPFRALPVVYTDEVAAGQDRWFSERPKRTLDLVESFYRGCMEDGCAWVQGESPALRFLINTRTVPFNATAPFHCPSFSGCATGIITPLERFEEVQPVQAGDAIIGVLSSDWHCNGATLIIRKAMELPDKFLTKLPNGKTLGEQALTETRSYVHLVESLLAQNVEMHQIQPITGGGISKLATYERPFRYYITNWPKLPPLCEFMREQFSLSVADSYTTFNNGIGLCIIAPPGETDKILKVGDLTGYGLSVLGYVHEAESGKADVLLNHEGDTILHPPEE